MIVVALVIRLFLFHLRSALLPILSLPLAVLLSFVPMYLIGVPSTIMSLGGIAIAIGLGGFCLPARLVLHDQLLVL